MNESPNRQRLFVIRCAIFLLPILALAPFATKPYQADDHVNIWVAEQIAKSPFDFFGFDVDYGYARSPIYEVNHNPPGISYVLALVGVLTDWNIVALHLAMSLFAGLAALGTFELARDLSARGVAAAVTAVLTPAFLVSASALMTDVALLAFYVWAVVAWRRGCERASWWWLCFAAVCAAIAPLMKFYGVTLLPLLLLDGLMRRPGVRWWWLWLLVPVGVFGGFQAYMYTRYGVLPIFDAAGVASASHWRANEIASTRPMLTLVFLGGSMLPLGIVAAMRAGLRWSLGIAGFIVIACLPVFGGYSFIQLWIGASELFPPTVLMHVGVFSIVGLLLIAGTVRSLPGVARRDLPLVLAWLCGTLVFAVFINHYINVRAILPLLPVFAVVLCLREIRRLPFVAMVASGVLVSMWTLVADEDVAQHDEHAARVALERAAAEDVPLYYVAFWGFEYHLMDGGAGPLAFEEKTSFAEPALPLMEPGSLLIVDAYARAAWTPPPRGFEVIEEIHEPYTLAATNFDTAAHAGFYWHGIGLLPFRLGYTKPETFLLLRWNGADDGGAPSEPGADAVAEDH